jgi:nucleoside-diphosphate-sugar epimerase
MSLFRDYQLPVHIFRLAGIYGPGRSALDSVRAGVARRINKPGHAFGRIHVEDIVQTLLKSFENPHPGEAYNVSDDIPAPSHEVIAYACELLGRPVPPLVDFEEANLAPITRSFYMENRRTQNKKIKEQLGVKLKYPGFKEGLRGCLEAEEYAVNTIFKGMDDEDIHNVS